MSVVIGSVVTLPDGSTGVAFERVSDLNGKRWRVRSKDGYLSEYRTSVYHESSFSAVQAPPTHEVGDKVRVGPKGPSATVTAVTLGNPTTYDVEYTTYTVSGMPKTQAGAFEAHQLVGEGY